MDKKAARLLVIAANIVAVESRLAELRAEFQRVALGDARAVPERRGRSRSPSTLRARILAFFLADNTALTAGEVAVRLEGAKLEVVRTMLSKLAQEGALERVRWGLYRARQVDLTERDKP